MLEENNGLELKEARGGGGGGGGGRGGGGGGVTHTDREESRTLIVTTSYDMQRFSISEGRDSSGYLSAQRVQRQTSWSPFETRISRIFIKVLLVFL